MHYKRVHVRCTGLVLSAAGTYQLSNAQSNPGSHITLLCGSRNTPFTVNFARTTFLLTVRPPTHIRAVHPASNSTAACALDPCGPVQNAILPGLTLSYCTNVVVNGGTFAFTLPQRPVAQGTITAINPATATWTVQAPPTLRLGPIVKRGDQEEHSYRRPASLTCCAATQVHADYLASFQRMQTQFGNGVTDGINTYDMNTLQLKTYAYGPALNSGGWHCSWHPPTESPMILQDMPSGLRCAAAIVTPGSVVYLGGNSYTMQVVSVYPSVGDYFTVRAVACCNARRCPAVCFDA